MTGQEIEIAFKAQLALEFNCSPEAFSGGENVVTLPILHERRRRFSERPFFLQMATFGDNAVISANEVLHPWLTEWVKGKRGFWLFEQHNFYLLEQELPHPALLLAQFLLLSFHLTAFVREPYV